MPLNYQNVFAQLQMYIDMVSSPPFEDGQILELTERWISNNLENEVDDEFLVRLVNDLSEQYIVRIENQPNNNLYDFLLDAFEHLSTFALIQMVLIVCVV